MKTFSFFTTSIFYGAGDITKSDVAELNRQVEMVHSINSGMQQSCHCDYPCKCESMNMAMHKLKDALGKSIKAALDI